MNKIENKMIYSIGCVNVNMRGTKDPSTILNNENDKVNTIKSIIDKDLDIIIFTEWLKDTDIVEIKNFEEKMVKSFKEKGYEVKISNNKCVNNVLIAFKNEKTECLDCYTFNSDNKDLVPEHMAIKLKDLNTEKQFILAGIRIKTLPDYSKRFLQFKYLLDYLEAYNEKIIIIGDFNNGIIRNDINIYDTKSGAKHYNYYKIANYNKKYKMHTPKLGDDKENPLNFSWVNENKQKFAQDHMITKGIPYVCTLEYDWDFVTNENGYMDLDKNSYKSADDMIGFPDHAILTSEIEL